MATKRTRRPATPKKKAATRKRTNPKSRRYPPMTSTRVIGFFRRLKTLPSIGQMERLLIEEAMYRTDDNKTHSAKILGMTREGLRKKMLRVWGRA